MKHSLQLKLSQHLTLTPQLQQSIRLLQLSTLELNQEIERFLQDNPLLEREEGPEEERTAGQLTRIPHQRVHLVYDQHDNVDLREKEEAPVDAPEPDVEWREEGGGSYSGHDEGEDSEYPQLAAESHSLREHLLWQVNLMQGEERDKRIVALLVDTLDDDGYMTQDLEELAAMLPAGLEVDPSELTIALKHLQNLEPAGIGARNLSECLSLQLEALPEDTPFRADALTTVRTHLDLLAGRDFAKLKKLLRCNDDVLRGVQSLIISLNPRPGAGFSP
jgi:RNA polymerase sigma-54 factor